jgi:hypothetical protein
MLYDINCQFISFFWHFVDMGIIRQGFFFNLWQSNQILKWHWRPKFIARGSTYWSLDLSGNTLLQAIYGAEWNDLHLVTFGIFAHVNFPAPLYFFFRSAELLVLSINVINRIDNCYNLLNWINKHWWPLSTLAVICFC